MAVGEVQPFWHAVSLATDFDWDARVAPACVSSCTSHLIVRLRRSLSSLQLTVVQLAAHTQGLHSLQLTVVLSTCNAMLCMQASLISSVRSHDRVTEEVQQCSNDASTGGCTFAAGQR